MRLRVKEICKEKGITQKQLAEKIGVAEISLSRSINTNPTLSTMENIATALDVDIVELFEKRGDFIALISMNGTNYRFDNVEALKSFANNIKAE